MYHHVVDFSETFLEVGNTCFPRLRYLAQQGIACSTGDACVDAFEVVSAVTDPILDPLHFMIDYLPSFLCGFKRFSRRDATEAFREEPSQACLVIEFPDCFVQLFAFSHRQCHGFIEIAQPGFFACFLAVEVHTFGSG